MRRSSVCSTVVGASPSSTAPPTVEGLFRRCCGCHVAEAAGGAACGASITPCRAGACAIVIAATATATSYRADLPRLPQAGKLTHLLPVMPVLSASLCRRTHHLTVPIRRAQVGMQNSALGALLATLHFSDPLTPVPCAISACTHSIVGSGIAAYWRLSSVAVNDDGAIARCKLAEFYSPRHTGGSEAQSRCTIELVHRGKVSGTAMPECTPIQHESAYLHMCLRRKTG